MLFSIIILLVLFHPHVLGLNKYTRSNHIRWISVAKAHTACALVFCLVDMKAHGSIRYFAGG